MNRQDFYGATQRPYVQMVLLSKKIEIKKPINFDRLRSCNAK